MIPSSSIFLTCVWTFCLWISGNLYDFVFIGSEEVIGISCCTASVCVKLSLGRWKMSGKVHRTFRASFSSWFKWDTLKRSMTALVRSKVSVGLSLVHEVWNGKFGSYCFLQVVTSLRERKRERDIQRCSLQKC